MASVFFPLAFLVSPGFLRGVWLSFWFSFGPAPPPANPAKDYLFVWALKEGLLC